MESTKWCSLFCTGNESIGELEIEFREGESVPVPVCQECLDQVMQNQKEALARILGL